MIPSEQDARYFSLKFLRYYTFKLDEIITLFKENHLSQGLAKLEENKRNFQHMFSLFVKALHTNHTYDAVTVSLAAITMKVLQLRFSSSEVRSILHNMLCSLDMILAERESKCDESFFQTYADVAIYTAKQETLVPNASIPAAVDVLLPRKERINQGLKGGLISVRTYLI